MSITPDTYQDSRGLLLLLPCGSVEVTDDSDYGKPWPFKTGPALPTTIKQYISREQEDTRSEKLRTPSFRALNQCFFMEVETGISIAPLFWATQTRTRQLAYCAPTLQPCNDERKFISLVENVSSLQPLRRQVLRC